MKHLTLVILLALAPLSWGRMFTIAWRSRGFNWTGTEQAVHTVCRGGKGKNTLSSTRPKPTNYLSKLDLMSTGLNRLGA
jgi:hypothetical protein